MQNVPFSKNATMVRSSTTRDMLSSQTRVSIYNGYWLTSPKICFQNSHHNQKQRPTRRARRLRDSSPEEYNRRTTSTIPASSGTFAPPHEDPAHKNMPFIQNIPRA